MKEFSESSASSTLSKTHVGGVLAGISLPDR
jgi:hypothetical protein